MYKNPYTQEKSGWTQISKLTPYLVVKDQPLITDELEEGQVEIPEVHSRKRM